MALLILGGWGERCVGSWKANEQRKFKFERKVYELKISGTLSFKTAVVSSKIVYVKIGICHKQWSIYRVTKAQGPKRVREIINKSNNCWVYIRIEINSAETGMKVTIQGVTGGKDQTSGGCSLC